MNKKNFVSHGGRSAHSLVCWSFIGGHRVGTFGIGVWGTEIHLTLDLQSLRLAVVTSVSCTWFVERAVSRAVL